MNEEQPFYAANRYNFSSQPVSQEDRKRNARTGKAHE